MTSEARKPTPASSHLIRNGQVIEDYFTHVADGAPVPEDGAVIVSLARFLKEREALLARPGSIGVKLGPADDESVLAADLQRLQLVAIDFPKFRDGRGFTHARNLRVRYGFEGELRATGDVLPDQMFYMARAGINAFEVRGDKSLDDALESLADFSGSYQAAADDSNNFYLRTRAQP